MIESLRATSNSYTELPKIEEIVKVTNLGEFNHRPNLIDILNRVSILNPNLDFTQIAIYNITETQATLEVVPGSAVYSPGAITLTYEIDHRISLFDVLLRPFIKDFGVYPNEELILEYAQIKNPDLNINELNVSEITDSSARLTVKPDSKVYYQGSGVIYYSVTLPPIDIYIPSNNLGTFETDPTIEQVMDQLVEWITDKDIKPHVRTDIEVRSIDKINHFVWIQPVKDSIIFQQGPVRLIYRLVGENNDYRINLEDVISQHALGHYNKDLTEQDVLKLLNLYNPGIDLTQIKVVSIADGKIKINVIEGSIIYKSGDIIFTYTVEGPIHLTEHLIWADLGIVEFVPSEEEILMQLKETNPQLVVTELHVSEIIPGSRWKAIVVVNDDSTRYISGESMDINFDVALTNLTIDLKITNLGNFETKPTEEEIFTKLLELNPNLKIDELILTTEIGDYSVSLKVKEGSYIYNPSATTLTFSVGELTYLEEVLVNPNLGIFENWPNDEELLLILGLFNPDLNLNQIEIGNRLTNKNITYVFIHVVERSTAYYPQTILIQFQQAIN